MMLVGETAFTATALANGKALVVYDGFVDPAAPPRPRAEAWDPATDAWTPAPGPTKPRSYFALVGLKDGRALVAGGLNEGGPEGQSYSSACIIDLRPGHPACEPTGLMTIARTAPSAAALSEGRVLVAGGYFNTGWTAAVGLDAGLASVTLAAYRHSPATREDDTGPVLGDVVESPHGIALATAEIFDPASGTWTATGPMHYARVRAPMTLLSDGRLLVVGSFGDDAVGVHPDAYVTAEIWDPRTGRWTLTGRLPAIDHAAIRANGVTLPDDEGAPGAMGTLVALPDGGAALVDNDRWWKHRADVVRTFRYDPATNSWRQVGQACASAGDPARGAWKSTSGCWSSDATVPVAGGKVVGLGGGPYGGESASSSDHRGARLVDPATGKVTELPAMPAARTIDQVIALADGSVLVIGGIDSEGEYARTALRLVPG
jgi:hypothetical protein